MISDASGQRGLFWVALAALCGMAVSAVFSDWLHWPRSVFLIAYVTLIGMLLVAFARALMIDVRPLVVHLWPWGVLGTVLASAILIANVLGQPGSARPEGLALLGTLLWVGVIYGAIDGLLLSVLPVFAVGYPLGDAPFVRRLRLGALALLACAVVTVAYHFGYAEFRGSSMLGALVGNMLITGLLLGTRCPIAAVATHAIMHVAAVLHGMETVLQLPPHL